MKNFGRFMVVADAFASFSKDATKVGAVVVDNLGVVRSAGWNGAPRGSDADEDDRAERPEKYHWFAHAEANAIAQAAASGQSLMGCTIVVNLPPCMECAKLIVQAGIWRVIHKAGDAAFRERWADSLARSERLFNECGVRTEVYE